MLGVSRKKKSFDEATGLTNNTIRNQYAYLYESEISDLQIEDGRSQGFVAWKIDDLSHLSETDKNKFIQINIYSCFFLTFFNSSFFIQHFWFNMSAAIITGYIKRRALAVSGRAFPFNLKAPPPTRFSRQPQKEKIDSPKSIKIRFISRQSEGVALAE